MDWILDFTWFSSCKKSTRWPFTWFPTSRWHKNKGCALKHGPHTKTELLFCIVNGRFGRIWMVTMYISSCKKSTLTIGSAILNSPLSPLSVCALTHSLLSRSLATRRAFSLESQFQRIVIIHCHLSFTYKGTLLSHLWTWSIVTQVNKKSKS